VSHVPLFGVRRLLHTPWVLALSACCGSPSRTGLARFVSSEPSVTGHMDRLRGWDSASEGISSRMKARVRRLGPTATFGQVEYGKLQQETRGTPALGDTNSREGLQAAGNP
jgi:hypothetical protein